MADINKILDFSSGTLTKNPQYLKFKEKMTSIGEPYKIALLPDVHIKSKLESPSGAAYAVKNAFSLKLTSPSPNCGMAMVQLPISGEEINQEKYLKDIVSYFCQQIPLNRKDPILNREQVIKIFNEGVVALVKIFGMDERYVKNFEFEGNIFNLTNKQPEDIDTIIPEFLTDLSRYRFGIIGGGNHFLEFQEVEEIYEPVIAANFGIQPGRASILFHTGSEAVGSLIGRIYAQRSKTSLGMNLRLAPTKFKFLLHQKGIGNIYKFFQSSDLVLFPNQGSLSRDVLDAYYSAFNFGYANRFYILDQIIKTLEHVLGKKVDAKLLIDISHNSIIKESFENEDYWIHRHNSVRIPPMSELDNHPVFSEYGYPLIIPGTDRTSTYICIRGNDPEKTINSMDHGFGQLVKNMLLSGNSSPKNSKTRMFNYTETGFTENHLLNDDFLDDRIHYLENEGILKPVARLRPFATLKGPKPKLN